VLFFLIQVNMKTYMLETYLDMHKYEGQSSFYLDWVKEFILE